MVSPPIRDYIDQLADRSLSILIPGCGNGYEGIYLVKKGFENVHFLDFSTIPMNTIRTQLPELPSENVHVQDFFEHRGTYDLIMEQTLFCAIDPKLRKQYAEHVHALLKPTGKLVGVMFDRSFEGGPPFGGSKEEYLELFSPIFSNVKMESCYNSIEPRRGTELFVQFEK